GFEVIYLNEGDTSKFDGFRVPGEPPPKPRKLSDKQKEESQERIAGIRIWVGPDGKNWGKIPAEAEEVKGAGGKVHPVGQTFQVLRQMGFLFHQRLFDVLNESGFQPEVNRNKIRIPRDKSMFVTVAEKAEKDKETFAAYDVWCKGDSTRAGKIPAYDTRVTLPETGDVIDFGRRMGALIYQGRVDPQGMIAQALNARGLQTESRGDKTFLVHPKGAAGGESRSVSATTQKATKPAVLGRPKGAAGGELRSVSATTQKVANLAVGRRPLPWEGASGSGVAVVRESVILPPGVVREAEAGGSVLYWVGPEPQGSAAAKTKRLLARMCKTVLGAAVTAPVIMLRPALDEQGRGDDLRDLRRLVQQFALKQQQPLVIATDSPSAPLKQMSQTYGVTILHRVPGNATGTHATTSVNLDNIWLITNGPTTITRGESFTKPLVKKAAATPAHIRPRPVTPALAKLLLTPDRAAKLDLLTEYRDTLRTELARGELDAIITATEPDAWFRKTRPLLGELGTPERAPLVLDYQEQQTPSDRNLILLNDHARGIPVDQRVTLIEDSGHPTTSAKAAMEAVDIMFREGETAALHHVTKNSTQLNTNERKDWVTAIANLVPQHPDKNTQLITLSNAIFDCNKNDLN
ncbi:hypothetical protein ACLQ24_28880, partial [Micromonospora sp. DT4]|uniref:hypothetical protein n=1 Tax=Micromonospora sp. DT4 TaxID=3393438 RepID=UPI003CF3A882